MNTPETITEHLNNRADKALRTSVEASISSFNDAPYITQSRYTKVAIIHWEDIPIADQKPDGDKRRQVAQEINVRDLLHLICEAVISERTDPVRTLYVAEFMNKIDSLGAEIEELRNSISQ